MSDKSREDFESWYKARTDGFMPSCIDGEYDWADAQPCWEAWQAALAQQPAPVAVPDGWKLVPTDATSEMVEALKARATATSRGTILNAGNALNDAIAAAPAAPVAQEPVAWMTEESWRRLQDGGNDSRGTVPVRGMKTSVARIPLYAAPPAAEQPACVSDSAESETQAGLTAADETQAGEQPDAVKVPRELIVRLDRMYSEGMSINPELEELRAILAGGDKP